MFAGIVQRSRAHVKYLYGNTKMLHLLYVHQQCSTTTHIVAAALQHSFVRRLRNERTKNTTRKRKEMPTIVCRIALNRIKLLNFLRNILTNTVLSTSQQLACKHISPIMIRHGYRSLPSRRESVMSDVEVVSCLSEKKNVQQQLE